MEKKGRNKGNLKMAEQKKTRKIKEVDPYATKEESFKEPNPEQYNVGKKLKKMLKDILKE
jgi:hypothetical protein